MACDVRVLPLIRPKASPMFRKKPAAARKQDTDPRAVDWIILAASITGLAVVVAASIQAGENGLAANLTSLVATTAEF